MNPATPQSPNDTAEAQLVAYLDGELNDQQTEAVEQQLSRDANLRRRLHDLQRAWDLLDSLPRSEATENFTQSTLEMVAVQAEAEVTQVAQQTRRTQSWVLGSAVSGVLAALLAGFLVGRNLWPSPDEPLVRDLPVIERVDEYLFAEDIEFLKLLDREGLFPEESRDAP